MENEFEVNVMYKGEELALPAKLVSFGYSYWIEVDVQGQKIRLSPDEERQWCVSFADDAGGTVIEEGLLRDILAEIDRMRA